MKNIQKYLMTSLAGTILGACSSNNIDNYSESPRNPSREFNAMYDSFPECQSFFYGLRDQIESAKLEDKNNFKSNNGNNNSE
jgi:hypothetical protein